jgi:hypothetical protein
MTKYTAGPWRLGDDALHGKALTIWAAEPGMCITSVFDSSMGPDAPPMREALANARLIASAPQLSEALRLIMKLGPRPWMSAPITWPEWEGAMETAQTALDRIAGLK